jgi:hypothetical protein
MVKPVLGTGAGKRLADARMESGPGSRPSNTSSSFVLAIFRWHMENTADMGHFGCPIFQGSTFEPHL